MTSKVYTKYDISEEKKISQGSIFRDISVNFTDLKGTNPIVLSFAVIISQACDIKQTDGSAFLPNLIILPVYEWTKFKKGEHLYSDDDSKPSHGIKFTSDYDSDLFFSKDQKKKGKAYRLVENNSEIRYHFLDKFEPTINDYLIVDFKHHYTVSKELVFNTWNNKHMHIANLIDLYKERLSLRFCNYLSRIGLPD